MLNEQYISSSRQIIATLNLCIVLLFVLLSTSGYAQFYEPFNSNSKKLFTTYPVATKGYSMVFDSAQFDGADSVYYHFGDLNDTSTFIHPDCLWWAGPYCQKTNIPVWSGKFFRTDNVGHYFLGNLYGDTLSFNMNINLNDTSIFFEDNVQRFSITLEDIDTLTILNYTDSVRAYKILHTDLSGTPINSDLNEKYLRIGKDIGLTNFFKIDSFPVVLRPLELIGDADQELGIYQITDGMLYDYQVNDGFQIRSSLQDYQHLHFRFVLMW